MDPEVEVKVTVPEETTVVEETVADPIALGLGRVEGLLTGVVDRISKLEEKVEQTWNKAESAQSTAEVALSQPPTIVEVEAEPEEEESDSEVVSLELEPEPESKDESKPEEPQKRPMTNLWHHL